MPKLFYYGRTRKAYLSENRTSEQCYPDRKAVCRREQVASGFSKRQIREAYRKHKYLLIDPLKAAGKKAAIAFIWLDNELHASDEIEEKVKKLLLITAERML